MKTIQIKRVLYFLLITAMVAAILPFSALAEGDTLIANANWPEKGAGVEGDPYLIENGSDLLAFASKIGTTALAGKHVKLTVDVDLNPGWTASSTAPGVKWPWKYDCFTGVFDGDGHTISGIYLNAKDNSGGDVDYVGIFGGFLAANKSIEVKNLCIENAYVSGGVSNGYIGSLLGITSGGGTETTAIFRNVYVDAIVNSSKMRVGGMVGWAQKGLAMTFEDCVFAGTVCTTVTGSEANVGGFIGRMEPSTTSRVLFDTCAFYGSVQSTNATDYIGGFVGVITNAFEENDIVFRNCICAGRIDGPSGTKNSGNFGKLSNSSAVLVMDRCLYVEMFYVNGVRQSWNKPFNDGGATIKTSTTFGELYNEAELNGLSALTLPHVDVTAWKASPENNFPLPAAVYNMIYGATDTQPSESVTKFVGYQLSDVNAEGDFSTRLVAVLANDDLDSYSKVGFKAVVSAEGNPDVEILQNCTSVYTSLIGKDSNDSVITYTAESLGGAYIFALNINDIPQSLGNVTVTVTTFHCMKGETTVVEDCTSVITIDASQLK